MEGKTNKLEEKSNVHDERINDCQEKLNNLESRLNELMGKISEILGKYETFEEKIKLMESLNSSAEGSGDLSSKFNFYYLFYKLFILGLISEIAEIKNRFKNYVIFNQKLYKFS